jgi:hypothetical protein
MFRVEWLQSALDALARLWIRANSTERQAITAASQSIDRKLSEDPNNEGESRFGAIRITFVPPLVILFQNETDGETVTVLEVRLFRPRSA